MTRAFITSSILAGLALATSPVAAQDSPDIDEATRAELVRLRDEALTHDGAGRYALAAELYLELHDGMQRAGLPRAAVALWNAGLALTHLPDRHHDAREVLQRFLDESTSLTDDPQIRDWRSAAVANIAELEARIGSSDASTTPGDNDATAAEVSADDGDATSTPTGSGISPVGPVVLGTGVLALGIGGVFGALALTRESDLAARCGGLSCLDTPQHRGIYDEMRTFGTVTDVLLVVGGLAAITGTILTFTLTEGGGSETTVTASLRHGGAALAIGGSF